MKKAAKNKLSWVQFSSENGEKETVSLLISTIQAETLLLLAVEQIGIDWCIERLLQVKAKDGKLDTVLQVVLGPRKDSEETKP